MEITKAQGHAITRNIRALYIHTEKLSSCEKKGVKKGILERITGPIAREKARITTAGV
jgi:hypothetical protein